MFYILSSICKTNYTLLIRIKEAVVIVISRVLPVPTVHYDNSNRLVNTSSDFMGTENCKLGYEFLEKYYNSNPIINHLDLSKEIVEEPVYIDAFHYSKNMNKHLANKIAKHIKTYYPGIF